jgi:8-oxo-dGTP pyrophosphatase MutT (NUDIX family)
MDKKPGIGCAVMLVRDEKVLLGKRNIDPKKADSELHGEGTWTMPGGKLHFGETLLQAAKRELFEETGIIAQEKDLKLISLTDDILPDAHFVTVGFLCDNFKGEAEVKEPDEITEWQWFDIKNPPSPMFFPSKKVLDNFSGGKIY